MADERQQLSPRSRFWAQHRARLTLLGIAALAGGGIVCMLAVVLILIARQ